MRRILCAVLLVAAPAALPATVAGAADTQFTLTTSYTGLYPGADVSVPVTVHNPKSYNLAVHTAEVQVGDASSGCAAANLEAFSYAGDVVAAPHRDAVIPIRMRMLASAPDACQGATFPLRLTASGSPVGGQPNEEHGGFAFTGTNSWTTTIAGAGALAGGLLLLRGRRRRSSGVPS